jgi:hypothetical protein
MRTRDRGVGRRLPAVSVARTGQAGSWRQLTLQVVVARSEKSTAARGKYVSESAEEMKPVAHRSAWAASHARWRSEEWFMKG